MTTPFPSQSCNCLLSRLPASEFNRLSPLLEVVRLECNRVLNRIREPIEDVYFPEGGVISAMTIMGDGRAIEVATIGKEGMAGLTVQRHMVGYAGGERQMLAPFDARRAGGDLLELAPIFNRRLRLHIECVDMAGSALKKDQDAVLSLAPATACARSPGPLAVASQAILGPTRQDLVGK